QICAASSYAHGSMVHGALRPEAVWLSREGVVKLGEFGVALAVISLRGVKILNPAEQAWIAPEVRLGKTADARTDIFGLGSVLYALLTSRSATSEFLAPSRVHPEASAEIDRVLLKCLASEPRERFSAPDDLLRALARAVGEEPPPVASPKEP